MLRFGYSLCSMRTEKDYPLFVAIGKGLRGVDGID